MYKWCISNIYVKYKITIPISQCSNLKTTETKALIDCGAEGKFVDSSLIDWKQVHRLKKPIPVHNVDGTSNKAEALRYKIQISYNIQQKQFKDWFYVMKLGDQKNDTWTALAPQDQPLRRLVYRNS